MCHGWGSRSSPARPTRRPKGAGGALLPDARRGSAGGAARLQGPGRLRPGEGLRAGGVLLPRTSWRRSSGNGSPASTTAVPIGSLVDPRLPGLTMTPVQRFEIRDRPGRLDRDPPRPGPAAGVPAGEWRAVRHYGVEIGGLRYNGPGDRRLPGPHQRLTRALARDCGRSGQPRRHQRGSTSVIPVTAAGTSCPGNTPRTGMPFSAETLAYAGAGRPEGAVPGHQAGAVRTCSARGTWAWQPTGPSGGWRCGWPPTGRPCRRPGPEADVTSLPAVRRVRAAQQEPGPGGDVPAAGGGGPGGRLLRRRDGDRE